MLVVVIIVVKLAKWILHNLRDGEIQQPMPLFCNFYFALSSAVILFSVLASSITSASLALADAGIEMYSLAAGASLVSSWVVPTVVGYQCLY